MNPGRIAVWLLLVMFIPGLALAQSAEASGSTPGSIQGTVKDDSGSAVAGAVVTLETASPASQRTAITDQTGSFRFSAVAIGSYKITITASGFAVWTMPNVTVTSSANQPSIPAVLQVASASSSMDVTLSSHELATEQIKAEEKQRLLGVFPDFFVAYAPNAAPLTAAQKFQLGWKTISDPISLLGTGIAAGIQQGRNNYPEFGQGAEGYAKRFGAQYANRAGHVIVGQVIAQSIFHQDPRYFYKGTGSFRSRALYAIGTAFVARGDNGKWQFDYSDILGGMAAHELSTLYYPDTSRPVRRLADDVLLGFAGRAEDHLLHEFILRRLTTHVPRMAARLAPRILPDGTPVPLISVEDWTAKTMGSGGPVVFMLASDIQVAGAVIAPAGSKAWGHASFRGGGNKAVQVGLDNVRLKIGDLDVPLRSTPLKSGSAPLEYHRLGNSGRVSILMYTDGDVSLPLTR